MEEIIIAIDAMGGDHGLSVTVPAAFKILKKHPNLKLFLVGNSEKINAKISTLPKRLLKYKNRIEVKHASEEVLMDELPSKALRSKKDSSMRVAINLVKEGTAKACVSAGNTGALMATARFVLKTLPGIDRPAIVTSFPTRIQDKRVYVLDLGANVDSDCNYLYQFAVMGSVLSSVVDNIEQPKIALLNIGSEEIKGNEQVKKAAQMLIENKDINYVGNVEGDDIFKGNVDVIVCDGFVGNAVLKSVEGLAKLIGFYVKQVITRNLFNRFITILALPILKNLWRLLDPSKHNGATLIGLQGVVVKSHASANVESFMSALEVAILEAERNVPQQIRDKVAKILSHQVSK